MRTTDKRSIVRGTALLACLFIMPSFALAGDGMVAADSLRAAVVDTLISIASRQGLKIEAAVPVVANILVKEVDSPRIVVGEAHIEAGKPNVRVPVDLLAGDGSVARSVSVIARIKTFATVAVAAQDIPRGDKLTSLTVVFQDVDVTGLTGCLYDEIALSRRQVKRSVRAGMVLSDVNCEPVPVIKRGDTVLMKVQVGGIVLTAKGTARENGGINDVIRVYSETTKKTLDCKVIDPKTVVVGG